MIIAFTDHDSFKKRSAKGKGSSENFQKIFIGKSIFLALLQYFTKDSVKNYFYRTLRRCEQNSTVLVLPTILLTFIKNENF